MSQPQGYTDFDAELNFSATPAFHQPPPPPAFDNFANQHQQPATFAAFESPVQQTWANQPDHYAQPPSAQFHQQDPYSQAPPVQFQQQDVYSQVPPAQFHQDQGGNNAYNPNQGYAQFDEQYNQQQPQHVSVDMNEQGQPMQPPDGPRHPIASGAHVIFKAAAILCWFFVSEEKFVQNFIAVVVLSAADFWVTKNVSGRLLVGLRWWNEIKEDGTNEWIFESLEGKRQVLPTETMLFWGSLLGNTVAWGVFAIMQLISFDAQWLLEAVIVFVLSLANLVGYFKSAREARKRVQSLATSMMMTHAVGYMAGGGQ